MRIFLPLLGLAIIGAVTAGEAETVELYVEYGEFTLDGNQDPAELLGTIREGTPTGIPESRILIFSDLPDEGGEVALEKSTAKEWVSEGRDLMGTEQCTLECRVEKTPEGEWILETFDFQIGEEVPFLVCQERYGAGKEEREKVYTQRTRSVGFIVSKLSVSVESGIRKVIDARIEQEPDKTVCRYVAVWLEDAASSD
jgi:hypothetical protein